MERFKPIQLEKVKGKYLSKAEGLHITAGAAGMDKDFLKRIGLLSQKDVDRIRWMESIVLKVDKDHGKPFLIIFGRYYSDL